MRLIFIQVLVRFYLFANVFDHWVERERAKQVCFVALGRGSSPKAQRAGKEKQDLNLVNVTMYSDGLICLEMLVLVEVILPPTVQTVSDLPSHSDKPMSCLTQLLGQLYSAHS